MDGWFVRCWCELRLVENAGEAFSCLEIQQNVIQIS